MNFRRYLAPVFFSKVFDGQISFIRDATGAVVALALNQQGASQQGRRVS